MKSLSLSLLTLYFSFFLNFNVFGIRANNVKTNSKLIIYDLTLKTSLFEDQVFIYVLESEISEENSVRIIDFISKRKGVNSCVIDKITRKLTITVVPEMQKNDMDEIVHYVEHNFIN